MNKTLMHSMILPMVMATFFVANIVVAQEEKETEGATETATQETTEEDEVEALELGGGKFVMQAPKAWETVEPKSSMIEVEYKIPMADGDETERDGRLTIMPAGGSIDANIDRWKAQFAASDGGSIDDSAKVEEIKVDGMTAHMVDITGTFAERAKMTDPPVMRENHRMLAAIVETGSLTYFVKFTGNGKTVEANKELFDNFIKSFAKSK